MDSRCGWCGVVREAFFHCNVWQELKIPDFVEVPAVAGASVFFMAVFFVVLLCRVLCDL